MGEILFAFVAIALTMVWLGVTTNRQNRWKKRVAQQGYESLGGSNSGHLFTKNGAVFLQTGNMTLNYKDPLIPAEVVGVGEITRNAKLVGLNVRVRVNNGEIKSLNISGSANQLLTIEDKLGYIE